MSNKHSVLASGSFTVCCHRFKILFSRTDDFDMEYNAVGLQLRSETISENNITVILLNEY